MNVDQATLNRTAANAHALAGTLNQMRAKANRAGVGTRAGELLDLTGKAATIRNDLVDAGAADPRPDRPATERPTETPLHLLDTHANRELLRCLLLTMDAALAVDKERGHDGDGFAEVIEHFAAGVQTEIYGPADLRQSGAHER